MEDDIYLPVSEGFDQSVTLTPSHAQTFDQSVTLIPSHEQAFDQSVTLTPSHEEAFGNLHSIPASIKDSIIDRYFDRRERITDWVAEGPEADGQPTPLALFPVEDKGKDIDIDSLSEASWVDARHPSSGLQSSLQVAPAFQPRGTRSPKMNALRRKSFESVLPVQQVPRQRSSSF